MIFGKNGILADNIGNKCWILAISPNFSWPFSSLQTWVNSEHLVHPHVPPQAYVALASGSEPKGYVGDISEVVLLPILSYISSLSNLWASIGSPRTCTGRCCTCQWPWTQRRCWETCLQWSWYPPFPDHQVWALYGHLVHPHVPARADVQQVSGPDPKGDVG